MFPILANNNVGFIVVAVLLMSLDVSRDFGCYQQTFDTFADF